MPTVDDEGDEEGNALIDVEKGKHMKEIKLDGSSKFLVPLKDGTFACKLVIRVPKDYEGCKIALNVQGVAGKMPLELAAVASGLKISGDNRNEISGFNLLAGTNNEIRFTPMESIKNYSLIIEAYGN